MRVSVAEMSGRSSSVAARLAMMVVVIIILITQTHCFSINQTITISYSAGCDGLNDDLSYLTGQTDLDSDEFMLDSEFGRRILAKTQGTFAQATSNAGNHLSCTRGKNPPPCHPDGANLKASPPHCNEPNYSKDCYHYDKAS